MGQTQCCESATAPTHLLNPALALKFIVSLFLFRTFKMTPLSLLNHSLFIWLLARPIEINWERSPRGNLRRQSLCCQLMWRNASNHCVLFVWDRTYRIVVLSQTQERARSCRNERILQIQQDWNRVWGRMAERQAPRLWQKLLPQRRLLLRNLHEWSTAWFRQVHKR